MKLSVLAAEPFAPDPEITGLASDSREVRPGFLFAALPGEREDGALYIPQAEKQGAAAVLARPGARARVPLVIDPDPRRRLSAIAARFHPRQPETVVGVTGTNGKTSTVRFAAQLWAGLGVKAGSIGTLGAEAPGFSRQLGFTTPEAIALHETLAAMAEVATHAAIEISSHALALHRADGVRLAGAAFTNLTQDHLDFHADFEDYAQAKLRLFTELAPAGAFACVNADGEGAERIVAAAQARGLATLSTGARGEFLRLLKAVPSASGLDIAVAHGGETRELRLPLVGAFQAENALLAAAIVAASGSDLARALALLGDLEGAPGRMQKVAEAAGAAVYVDYAHTPDAVATALAAIRPHATGKVVAVIGAGGDRDRGKRAAMGRAAAAAADIVIVADDNPRTEDPAVIRAAVRAGAPSALDIGDRAEAIEAAVALLAAGDALVICGKGHETGQTIGANTFPFDDADAARAAAKKRGRA